MKKSRLITTLFCASLVIMSCEKATESTTLDGGETSNETLVAIDDMNFANKMFQDAGNSTDDALIFVEDDMGPGLSEYNKTASQPQITVTPSDLTTFPKTITIDFGTGITGPDGILREGKIIVLSSDWYTEKNSQHITTFVEYYQNNYQIEGMHIEQNMGKNANGELVYKVLINDGEVISPSGKVIDYEQVSTRTWIAGDNTPLYVWDDEYLLDGEQIGRSSNNVIYELDVIDPLHFSLLPREIKSGSLKVDVGEYKNITIDYGSKTISINGVSYPL